MSPSKIKSLLGDLSDKASTKAQSLNEDTDTTECYSDNSGSSQPDPSRSSHSDPSKKGLPDPSSIATDSDDDDIGQEGDEEDDDNDAVDLANADGAKRGKAGKAERQESKAIVPAIDHKDWSVEKHVKYLLGTFLGGKQPLWKDRKHDIVIRPDGKSIGLTPVEDLIDHKLWLQVFVGYRSKSKNYQEAVEVIWGPAMTDGLFQAKAVLVGMKLTDLGRYNELGRRIIDCVSYPFLRSIAGQGSASDREEGYTWEDRFNQIIDKKLSKLSKLPKISTTKRTGTKPQSTRGKKRKRMSRGKTDQDQAGSSREHSSEPRRSSSRKKEPTVFFGRSDTSVIEIDLEDDPVTPTSCLQSDVAAPSGSGDLGDAEDNDGGDDDDSIGGGDSVRDDGNDEDNQPVNCDGQELQHQVRRTNNFVRARVEADQLLTADLVRSLGEHAGRVDAANLSCQNATMWYYQVVDQHLHQEVELQGQNCEKRIEELKAIHSVEIKDLGQQLLDLKKQNYELQDEVNDLRGELEPGADDLRDQLNDLQKEMERVVKEQGTEDAYKLLQADREELEYYRTGSSRFHK